MALVSRLACDQDHDAFRESVRRFLAAHLVDRLDEWRANGSFGSEFLSAAGSDGFLGVAVPEEFGGGGADDPRFTAVLLEEVAATGAAGLALVLARQLGVAVPALLRLGPEDVRRELVSGVAAGELATCVAVLDADLAARAAPGAVRADVFVLFNPAEPGIVSVVRREDIDVSECAKPLAGTESGAANVGVRADILAAAPTAPNDDGGFQVALDLWSAVVSISAAHAALDLTLEYVHERKVFGQAIATFENTRFRLAELGAELAAAQSLVATGLTQLAEGSLDPELAAAARLVSTHVLDRTVDQGMQFHGGYGYMREYPISHAFGDARFLRAAAAVVGEPRHTLAAALGI